MAALLVGLSIMMVMMTVAMPVWRQMAQREKEEELVFRGQQWARAVGLFQRKNANASVPSLDVLVQQRFVRKKYKDPITGKDFLPLTAGQAGTAASQPAGPSGRGSGQSGTSTPGATAPPLGQQTSSVGTPGSGTVGGVVGVTSESKERSIRMYNGRTHYNEWAFIYTPQVQQPGVGGAPGTAAPGQRGQGQRGNQPNQPGLGPGVGPGGNRTPPNRGPNGPGGNGPQRPGGAQDPFGPGNRPNNPFQPATPIGPPVRR